MNTFFSHSSGSRLGGPVSDKLLKMAEYVVVKGQFVAPGKHRLLMAGGLSLGLGSGRALMNVVSGQHPDGTPVHREDVALPLRPLTGIMHYNPYSDNPLDRWLHVADNMAPAVFGAAGVLAASRFHFRDRIDTAKIYENIAYGLEEGKLTFDKIEHAISMKQAEPIAKVTAATSLPGSASGANLTPVGYGPGLSSLFALRADRKVGMGWNPLRRLTRTVANSPLGSGDMMRELWRHLLHNPSAAPAELHELENLGNGVLKSIFPNPTPEQLSAWRDELLKHRGEIMALVEGKLSTAPEAIQRIAEESWERAEAFGVRQGMIDMRSPETVRQSLAIGDNGWLGRLSEKMSRATHAETDALRDNFARAVYERHHALATELGMPVGEALKESERYVPKPEAPRRVSRHVALGAAAASGIGLVAYGATRGDADEERKKANVAGHQDRLAHIVNGVPLTGMEWMGNSLNFPPGLHRLKNALGLSAGMYGGMKLGEVLTGQTLTGASVAKDDLISFVKPLHGRMAYEFNGLGQGNRWMKVAHYALPAIGGFVGTKVGSDFYFAGQREKNRNATFIDEYSQKISYDQSEPWSYLSAGSALANVGLGLSFLPVGYGTNLGNRFSLGTGRKVVLPGVKEAWSNNHSRYPLGPSLLRDYMINYVVNNPDAEPRQLHDMARGILQPWFGEQPDSRIREFAQDVLEVRNKYFVEGGIPKDRKAPLKQELRERFAGQGLHDELRKLGLDVLDARLGDNGFSGDIGNLLGARSAVKHDMQDFRQKVQERRREREVEAPVGGVSGFGERIRRGREQPGPVAGV